MTSLINHRWSIAPVESDTTHREGAAATLPDAWIAALAAGRAALLAGDLNTLAISIDETLEVLLDPGRDDTGVLDSTVVTAELVQIYQSVTVDHVIDRLVPSAQGGGI